MILLSKISLVFGIILLPFTYIKLFFNFSISDFLFSISFLLALLFQFRIKNSIKNIFNNNFFLFPIIIYLFGFIFSFNSSFSPIDSLFSFFQVLFIFIIIYYSFSFQNLSSLFIKNCLYVLAISSLMITIFIFIFYLTGTDYSYGLIFIKQGWGMSRFSYGDMEPNIAARIMAQNIPIVLFMILNSPKWFFKAFNILILILLLSVIILTASRSGLLIVVLGIGCYFIFNFRINKNYNIVKYLFFTFSVFSLMIIIYQMYPNFFEVALNRYSTILDYNVSASSKERLFVLSQSLDIINTSPIIGTGMNNSGNLTGTVVHNPIIISWLENGMLGFVGFLSIYIILAYYIAINYKNNFFNDRMLMLLSLITIMMIFGDMFMANSYKRALWVPAIIFITYSNQTIHFQGHKKHIDE